jgi:hypothetical protein
VVETGADEQNAREVTGRGWTYLSVDPDAFDHGGTRTAAARQASGEVLVFFSQDVLPAHPETLGTLLEAFSEQPDVGRLLRAAVAVGGCPPVRAGQEGVPVPGRFPVPGTRGPWAVGFSDGPRCPTPSPPTGDPTWRRWAGSVSGASCARTWPSRPACCWRGAVSATSRKSMVVHAHRAGFFGRAAPLLRHRFSPRQRSVDRRGLRPARPGRAAVHRVRQPPPAGDGARAPDPGIPGPGCRQASRLRPGAPTCVDASLRAPRPVLVAHLVVGHVLRPELTTD